MGLLCSTLAFIGTSENLEIVVHSVSEILQERFESFSLAQLNFITHMLSEHLHYQYENKYYEAAGADIRERIFAALLSINCDPFTGELGKKVQELYGLISFSGPSKVLIELESISHTVRRINFFEIFVFFE